MATLPAILAGLVVWADDGGAARSHYVCAETPATFASLGADGDSTSPPQGAEEDPLNQLKQRCFTLRQAFWAFELCPFRTIRQFRASDRRQPGLSYSIGTHRAGKDAVAPGDTTPGRASAQLSLLQTYDDGDDGRRAVVRYLCPQKAPASKSTTKGQEGALPLGAEGIVDVREPREMEYEVTFMSSTVCNALLGGGGRDGNGHDAGQRLGSELPAPMFLGDLLSDGKALQALRGRCFRHTQGYWTYTLCPMKSVRQSRLQGTKEGSKILLGKFARGQERAHLRSLPEYPGQGQRVVVSQRYVNGTAGRHVTVMVACGRGKHVHEVLHVDENPIHHYTLLFSTPLVCDVNCFPGKLVAPGSQIPIRSSGGAPADGAVAEEPLVRVDIARADSPIDASAVDEEDELGPHPGPVASGDSAAIGSGGHEGRERTDGD